MTAHDAAAPAPSALAAVVGGTVPGPEHAVGGIAPALVVRPADVHALAAAVRAVADAGAALVPLGGGAHRDLGHAPARYDVALVTDRLVTVRDHAPADMTVTVEAGVTIAALQEVLGRAGQWLPVDPPLPDATTVGGLIAADLGGALRGSQGRVRDLLIGVEVVTADGRRARAGGRVVKNVAGYDLMKLFTGSLGTLGVVTEATFKVRPRPETERVLVLAVPSHAAARLAATPLTCGPALLGASLETALGADAGARLVAHLGGVAADVAVAGARLADAAVAAGGAVVLDADAAAPDAAAALADHRDLARATTAPLVVRLAVLPAAVPALASELAALLPGAAGRALLDPRTGRVLLALASAGATASPAGPASVLAVLEAAAVRLGGHLVVERWPAELVATIAVWRPLPAALPLMRRAKAALDPAGVLAPGRFVGRI